MATKKKKDVPTISDVTEQVTKKEVNHATWREKIVDLAP